MLERLKMLISNVLDKLRVAIAAHNDLLAENAALKEQVAATNTPPCDAEKKE